MDLDNFTDVLGDNADEIGNSQPLSLSLTPPTETVACQNRIESESRTRNERPTRCTGQQGEFRSVQEIDSKYRDVFSYPYFNLVQSSVLDEALYSDKSMVVCAPTGSGKTVVFEMAIVQLLMELDDKNYTGDFKIIYMAPVKALCSERLSEWYPKFTKRGLMCIEVTGDTDVDFSQLKPYRIIITTPEKWDMLTRRWRDNKSLVDAIKLFLIDEVHILNDVNRGHVLEAVVSRMKTIESSSQSAHRIEQLQKQYQTNQDAENQNNITNNATMPVSIRFVAVSATVSNPEDVAAWLGTSHKPAVYYKFGDECRPVKLKRVVEGYPCSEGTSIFKFDIILNYKLWPVIKKYHDGKPTLIFCNTRKSVAMTAETLSRELTISFTPEQQARLSALASTIKNKKLQALVLSGVGCHHAGLLFEERLNIEKAFRNRDLPILITTTTLAMGVNLPAHLVIIKNTQQYINGAYQEYSISTVLQMVGRAGRPQFDTEATAVIMTRLQDKPRYQALVGGDEPLQSYLHKRLAENLNSEAALGTVCDVAQCVQWVRSTFLSVRAAKDPKRYLGLPQNAPPTLISKKIEELCVKAMNGLASTGLITMDEACCIESTEAGRLMSVYYLDLETMKHIMKIEGTETLEKLLWIVCESHELADMHLRVDERRILNALNRNNSAATIRFPMKGKINTRQMKLNCIIQAVLGCLPIPEPSLNQEAMKVMRIADRVCKCLVAYVTRPDLISNETQYFTAIVNAIILEKCIKAHLWENSPYVSKQLKGIGPTFSTLLATAGKVNFTLLEESHPRDLERIMNKGAPAGNVLRKQVSLLPKYQITAIPIDEKRISIQLLLLNQNQLAENRDQLTAGDSHRCYVVVGDSENYLLLFTSFMDKDLMNVYDGAITYEVTRKHNNEHRILIHCISSNWVGIDVNCEYLFKNIEPSFSRGEAINPIPIQDTLRKPTKKQTNITDVYKERKRKTNEIDITESKEKKKRQTALVEKFKLLKNSFEVTSKELKEDLAKSAEMSNMVIDRMIQPATESKIINIDDNGSFGDSRLASTDKQNDYTLINTIDLDDEDNFVIDEHINSIINEIETDILKTNNIPQNCTKNPLKVESSFFIKPTPKYGGDNSQIQHSSTQRSPNVDTFLMANKSLNEKRKHRSTKTKTNYSFMDNIEKNVMCDNDIEFPQKDNGFSDTIKSQIEKFLQSTAKTQRHDITIDGLLSCTENNSSSKNICPNQKTTSPKEDVNNCSIVESNKPLSLESPKVSVYPDNVQKVNQDIVNKPSKITCHSKKEHEDVVKEISTNTAKSDEVQNIDKIVEEIEREYNNIASKESYKKQECCADFENISKVNKFQDRKENDSKYFTNVTDNELHTITSKAECCLNEIITKDNIDNNSNTEKLEQCKARKKQVVENCNILAVNNVVSFMTIPKVSECDVHEFSKPLSINTILPTNLTVFDKLATTLSTDLCNNSNLYSITQCCPSKSKELVLNGDEIDQTVQPYDLDKRYHKISIQKDDNNEKDAENKMIITLLKPALPILNENSSLNNHVTHQNNYAEHNDRDSEKPGEGSENIMLNTTLVPTSPMTNMNISYNNHIAYPYSSTKYHDSASEEASKNEKPEKYINRYSFSATKINVSTKNLPDHEVKIIRKLKLDLDVTEIVSKGNKRETCNKPEITKEDSKYHRTDETEVGKTKRQEQYYSTSIDTMKMLQHLNGKKEIAVSDVNRHRHCSPQTEMDNQIISRNLIYIPTLKYPSLIAQKENSNDVKVVANNETDVEKYSPMAQTSVCLTNAGNHLHLVAQSSYNKPEKTKPEDAEMNLTERLTSSRKEIKAKTNNIEEIVQYKNYLRDIAGANNLIEKNADIVTSETKEKVTPVKNCLVAESGNTTKNEQCNETNIKSNKIENILHKFSAILRKNNFLNNNTDKNPSNIHVIRPPLEKTKNSYKISNIHSVHIPLPKNLIAVEASRSSRPANDYTFTTIKDIEKYEDNINPPRDDDNAQTEVVMKNNVPECFTDELPEDIPEYHSPDIDDPQEGTTNFDLDQSLLNPKLLLEQCFAKDESNNNELIIPPPSDFCDDENIYSPVKLGEITSQEYNETEQGITSNYDHDKSIFEDDNNSVLTPSVEIETWILPQDDEETYNGNAYNNSDFSKQRRTTTYNRGIFQKNEDSTYYLSSQIVNQKRNIANKSCTVMRRNHNISKDVSSLPQDFEINSRQGKLGYFKFTPKKKFKL